MMINNKIGEAYARFVAAYNQTGNDETRLTEKKN